MAIFKITSEHTSSSMFDRVREFCKGKGIRVTKAWMDETFTGLSHIKVSCENKRFANKVRDFIWNEVNHGAFCEVVKVG